MSRRVLITGADSGLGLALTRRFVAAGDRVLATDIHPDPHEELGALLGDRCEYRRLDITSDERWSEVVDDVETLWGGLDVIVNCAGIADGGRIDVVSMESWKRIVEVNLLGVVRGCRAATPLFKRQKSGHIVNIASAAGLIHPPMMGSYNATKAAVVALSETLEFELAPFGIDVTVVCPTFFRTNLGTSLSGEDPVATRAARKLIDGAKATVDDVADEVFAGIGKRRRLILPARDGRFAYRVKRFARPLYARAMRSVSAKAAAKG